MAMHLRRRGRRRIQALLAVALAASFPASSATDTAPPDSPMPDLPMPGPLPGFADARPHKIPLHQTDLILEPAQPQHIRVEVGNVKYVRYWCPGGPVHGSPADAIIMFESYKLNADPLIVVSTKGIELPSFRSHSESTLSQWREDAPGEHYVTVRGLGPAGGVIGVLNLQQFGDEELEGLLRIRCSFIIVFDALFFDNLRQDHLCPIGRRGSLCSDNGACTKNGVCECDEAFNGQACAHRQEKMNIDSGTASFDIAPGEYQYFRAEVPQSFQGGYLKVHVSADKPVVVLVMLGSAPTKTDYDLSNFESWVSGSTTSDINYRVLPGGAEEILLLEPVIPLVGDEANGKGKGKNEASRRLLNELWQDKNSELASCPAKSEPPVLPEMKCQGTPYTNCVADCADCMTCTQASHGGLLTEKLDCEGQCRDCHSEVCTDVMAYCNKDIDCHGDIALRCDSECGTCMACMDENDFWSQDCYSDKCRCCAGCFGIEAKCERKKRVVEKKPKYVYVGIYNHRRHYSTNIKGKANLKLQQDPTFAESKMEKSWIGELYDPFTSLRHIDESQRDVYPEDEKFFYKLDMKGQGSKRINIQLYKDRVTLLHLTGVDGARLRLLFNAGPKITHVLSSDGAAPRTFFDFNREHKSELSEIGAAYMLRSTPGPSPDMWCAIFGGTDGALDVTVKSELAAEAVLPLPPRIPSSVSGIGQKVSPSIPGAVSGYLPGKVPSAIPGEISGITGRKPLSPSAGVDSQSVRPSPVGYALFLVLAVLGGLALLGHVQGGDSQPALADRIMRAIAGGGRNEATAALNRPDSLDGGYTGSEVIDRSVEDEYLHRGGFGDDGI